LIVLLLCSHRLIVLNLISAPNKGSEANRLIMMNRAAMTAGFMLVEELVNADPCGSEL
jgi:hypothetical protein